jgi:Zn-dependent protease
MMITLREVFDAILMAVVIGFIFKDWIAKNKTNMLDLTSYNSQTWKDFLFSMAVIAPAIILHEAAHKFVAQGFGLEAVFHAHYTFLGLGILLKLLNFGFIFVVPGFVSIVGSGFPWQFALIAFSGPAVHGLFWIIGKLALRSHNLNDNQTKFWILTSKINGFLFILNMLPIPGIDGFSFYSNIIKAFF